MDNKKPKILVVDDEIEFLNLMNEILSEKGYEVITANNGEEALKKLVKQVKLI